MERPDVSDLQELNEELLHEMEDYVYYCTKFKPNDEGTLAYLTAMQEIVRKMQASIDADVRSVAEN